MTFLHTRWIIMFNILVTGAKGQLGCEIKELSKDYPTAAKRPHYALLNKSKIKKTFDIKIPFWKDSLDECLRKIGKRS